MINVEINGKLVGQCESAGKASSPLFKDVIEPWIEIRGFTASSPSLTDDQQVVFEWLKDNGTPKEPFWALDDLNGELFYNGGFKTCISAAFSKLNSQQQYQVLAAFAEWGIVRMEDE